MFCPVCEDEFREGFTRCNDCDVALVVSLDDVPPPPPSAQRQERDFDRPPEPIDMEDYCGYLTLEESREARDTLRDHDIRCEIVIREAPGGDPSQPCVEEFWIRVEDRGHKQAGQILGMDDDDGPDDPSDDKRSFNPFG